MADKTLTARVRLNTTQADQAIRNLTIRINNLNRIVGQAGNSSSGITRNLRQADTTTSRLSSSQGRVNSLFTKTCSLGQSIVNKTKAWWSAQGKVRNSIKGSNDLLKSTLSRLKAIASAYLGVMGTKLAINTADTITSAENKMNYVTSQQLGDKGYNSDGSYSTSTLQNTQLAMDKMYASSQKVRMSYSDMMSNVSKSMALAGEAFGNSTDNAIRFQEVMAEAYAVGGASADEMSTSMYQLIQALGSGTLAGDELRSVREGAPLAYKEIEKFVQGVYDTNESLKDLASQGKVTSDMVVAAIMSAGDEMDNAFAQTAQTFTQTWTQIKNAATQAFRPIANSLRDMLNKAIDNGLLDKIETLFSNVSKALQIVFKVIEKGVDWIANNWSKVKDMLISGLITLGIILAGTATLAIINFVIAHWQLILIAIAIYFVVDAFRDWQSGAMLTTTFIMKCLNMIAIAIMVIGILTGNMTMFIVGVVAFVVLQIASNAQNLCDFIVQIAYYVASAIAVVLMIVLVVYLVTGAVMMSIPTLIALMVVAIILLLLALFLKFTEQISGAVMWLYALICNIIAGVGNFFVAAIQWGTVAFENCVNFILNLVNALGNAIGVLGNWISTAISNAWIDAQNAFWSFIEACLEGIKFLEPAINAIAKAFGAKGFTLSGLITNVQSKKQSYKKYASMSNAWNSGMSTYAYGDASAAWNDGMSTFSYKSLSDSYASGAEWGANLKDSINNWGSSLKDKLNVGGEEFADKFNSENFSLNSLGKKLGLDFGDTTGTNSGSVATSKPNLKNLLADDKLHTYDPVSSSGSGFPSANDPTYSVGDSYNMPSNDELLKGVDSISDDTSDISDSLDLTTEDLEYLRRVADMEWKKEFTTAEIRVDMSNYNTINGDNDLDGIVTKLADKLYEEMNVVADGVYA